MATEVLGAETDHSGRIVGNWRLVRPLGVGGFGAVYEAEHGTIPGRLGAVKILHAQMALNADMKRRFINEASAASRAAHENIVQIFDGGVTDSGLCYVVMELLTGQSLAALLRDGPLDASRTVNIATQVAAALSAAHGIGIVHRDLKPDNIFIVRRDTNPEFVKVLDFGIAKLEDGHGKTQTGMWLGTPPYMAPEQWQTLPDIDGRADLYALGVILYQCMTGRLPFSATTPFGWLTAHLQHPVPDPATYEGPAALLALVRRLLAKQREDRPQWAAEVLHELRQCVGEHDPPPPRTAVVDTSPPGAGATFVAPARPVLPWVVGLSGALLAGGLWWYTSVRAAPPSPPAATTAAAATGTTGADAAVTEAPPDLAQVAAPVAAGPQESSKRAAGKRSRGSKAAAPAAQAPALVPPADPPNPGHPPGQPDGAIRERRKYEPIY